MTAFKNRYLFILLFLILIFAIPTSARADSLRCEGRLVTTGDSQIEVENICGSPAFIDLSQKEVTFKTYRRLTNPPAENKDTPTKKHKQEDDYEFISKRSSLINIEVWTYNFGSSRFVRTLRFENDKLVSIRDGSYGFDRVEKDFDPRPGDSKAIVWMKYGSASDIQKDITYQENVTREENADYLYIKQQKTPLLKEKWIYDLGPSKNLQELYFENDRLVRTKSLKAKGKVSDETKEYLLQDSVSISK